MLLLNSKAEGATKNINFGIFPYLSSIRLLEIEGPLKIPVEAATKQAVSLITAPDMESFISRLKIDKYDLIAVPPHIARLAQKDFGYRSIVTADNLGFHYVVRKDSGIENLEDLTKVSIAVTGKYSLAYFYAIEALDKHSFLKDQKLDFCESQTHGNSLLAVINKKCQLAVVPSKLTPILLTSKQENQVNIIADVKSPLGILIMAHPSMDSAVEQRIKQFFLDFDQTIAGKNYFTKRGRDPFIKVDDEKLKSFDTILNKILKR